MSEIRASALAIYADEEHGNPLLVARDEHGAWRPVTRTVLCKGAYIHSSLKDAGMVLALDTEP